MKYVYANGWKNRLKQQPSNNYHTKYSILLFYFPIYSVSLCDLIQHTIINRSREPYLFSKKILKNADFEIQRSIEKTP